ncbi:MAG: hypothetical protein H7Y15_09555 [Pseudonocardia sp.]|nr:hypothetical protein [Pseudonocardia sp.]
MATRFYLPASGVAAITPSILTGWSLTTGFTAHPAVRTKSNTTHTNGTPRTKGSATQPWNRLDRVFVTEQLAAQTLSGNHDVVIRCGESNLAADAWLQFCLRVVSADGTVQRGIAYPLNAETVPSTVVGSNAQEFAVTPATRLRSNLPMTGVAVQAGDRLQFELGYRSSTTNTTYTGTMRYGDQVATADYTVGSANVTTDLCPFVQTTMDLAFLSVPPNPTPGRFFHVLAG